MDTLLTEKEVQATPDTTTVEANITKEMKVVEGKYQQVKPVAEGEVVKEVHEYVCPDGQVGYQAMIKANVKGKEMVKSFGVGPEAEARSHDWVEVTEEVL